MDIADNLRKDPGWHSPPKFEMVTQVLERMERLAWDLHEQAERASKGEKQSDRERFRHHELRRLAIDCRAAEELIKSSAHYTQNRVLLLTGPAGQGKTHTLVHELNRALAEGGIAVGVLGHNLSSHGDLWTAILQRLDYRGTLTEFLDELENAAASRGRRALLVFDALNETTDRKRWKGQLASMTNEVLARPHLTLALGVRSDYLSFVLPTLPDKQAPWVQYEHPGFSSIGADALLAYCSHFGVQAPIAPPIGELSNPLFVQLLVKSLQGCGSATHWFPSWMTVWESWMDHLEEETLGKLDLDDPSRARPIRRVLNKLAESMLDAGQFHLPRSQAEDISRKTVGTHSVIAYLCSAGALMDMIDEDDEDIIEFGYERLCDTFIMDRLLAHLFKGLESTADKHQTLALALDPNGSLTPLANPEMLDHPLNHHRSGLLAALCLAAPRHVGAEIPILLPLEHEDERGWHDNDWQLREAFVDSLRWRHRRDEFGCEPDELWKLWQKFCTMTSESELDELIRFALIPTHPFAMARLLHPWLLAMDSPGERDAVWSIHLVSLWFAESPSNLRVLVRWAKESALEGVQPSIALPAARLLAWMTSSSQQDLRLSATQGVTRLLAACPEVLPEFLPDFLEVNDAYVLESVLTATLGVVRNNKSPEVSAKIARQVYERVFPEGNARWCHLTIRHYARRIVEEVHAHGRFPEAELAVVQPPYRSFLQLEELPSKEELQAMDESRGYRAITFSCFGHDFFWYVMGATSGGKDFTSTPLPESDEPIRPFGGDNSPGGQARPNIFDINLAARFVVWNCKELGWTKNRFEEFDTGYFTGYTGRMSPEGRTERIGKKYQWIGWQTMLGFLTDNYEMTPEWNNDARHYDTPHQIGDIELHDPTRWLHPVTSDETAVSGDGFWSMPSMPRWPIPEKERIHAWAASANFDLQPADIIHTVPELPAEWGDGPWLRLAAEHSWIYKFAPGHWAFGGEFHTDIWWQIWPILVRTEDMPRLLEELDRQPVAERLAGIGRIDPDEDWHTSLLEWPALEGIFDRGFSMDSDSRMDTWLPVPWMPVIGSCGHPDRRDEHRPVLMPWPRLFREWDLDLDLRRGVVLHGNDVVFGLAGWIFGEQVIFARIEPLRALLTKSGCSLLWLLRGERRAFLDLDGHREGGTAWVDYHGLSYLGPDHVSNSLWYERLVR